MGTLESDTEASTDMRLDLDSEIKLLEDSLISSNHSELTINTLKRLVRVKGGVAPATDFIISTCEKVRIDLTKKVKILPLLSKTPLCKAGPPLSEVAVLFFPHCLFPVMIVYSGHNYQEDLQILAPKRQMIINCFSPS